MGQQLEDHPIPLLEVAEGCIQVLLLQELGLEGGSPLAQGLAGRQYIWGFLSVGLAWPRNKEGGREGGSSRRAEQGQKVG